MSAVATPFAFSQTRPAPPADLSDTAPPAERLFAAPQPFDFFQAVRLLEQMQPQRRAVGDNASPDEEIVRFKTAMGAAFPASSIADLSPGASSETQSLPPEMTIAFLGLTGPSGALPSHYTELLWRLQRDVRSTEKQAVRAWFDLFNHRLASLFYRAWQKYRPLIPYERGEYKDRSPDTFTQGLLSFAGLDGASACAGASVPGPYQLPRALVRYAGLLSQRPRNVANLRTILCDYFALPIEVLQFQGEWVALACDQQAQLGISGVLGSDATVGPRVWNRQGKIRIRIGPLTHTAFEKLLPCEHASEDGAPHLCEVAALVRCYVGPEIDFDVQLVLRRDEVPAARLNSPLGSQLGWDTWLGQNIATDRQDAVFASER